MARVKIKKLLLLTVNFLLLTSCLFARTRIKTVEYSFGSYYGAASLSAGTMWEPNSITVYIPEAPVTVKNAFLEYEAIGVNGDDIGTFQVYFDQDTSAGGTQVFISDDTNVYSTGEQVKIYARIKVTSVIDPALSPASYAAGVTVNGADVCAMSLKLYITYEYDDTKTTQIKTVRFPLYSDWLNKVAAKTAEAAEGPHVFYYYCDIEDITTLSGQWFEITGLNQNQQGKSAKDGTIITSQITGGSVSSAMYIDQGEMSGSGFRFIDHQGGADTSSGFSANVLSTVTVALAKAARWGVLRTEVLGGECFVNYEYSESASTKTKTVVYFLGQDEDGGAAYFSKIVHLKEKVLQIKEVYARIYGSYSDNDPASLTVISSISGQSVDQASYNLLALSPLVSGFTVIHSLTSKKDSWNIFTDTGTTVELSIGALPFLGGCGAELVITYDYTEEKAFTNYYQTFAGQTLTGLELLYNLNFDVWFPLPSAGTVTLRTAWLNSMFVQGPDNSGDGVSSQNPKTTLNIDSYDSQQVFHKTQMETWGQQVLYESRGQITLSPATVMANYIASDKTLFSGACNVVYDYIPAPYSPYSLVQYKSNGVTQISAGGWTNENKVVLVLKSSSPLSSDNIAVELELGQSAQEFTDVFTSSISAVSYAGSPVISTFTRTLAPDTTYHWQVRARGRGAYSSWQYFPEGAGDVDFDFGIDMSSPAVFYSGAEYGPWQKSSGTEYNVTFSDYLSKLDYLRYAVSTGAYQAAPLLVSWTDIADIDLAVYTDPWEIEFSSCLPGYNYVSVRAYDNVGNYISSNVFCVRKDTSPPDIGNPLEGGDDTWRESDPGAIYHFDFTDGLSYLDTARYIVYSATGMTGDIVKDWTDIFTSTNVASYSEYFSIDFSTLAAGYNYVSVRCWDMAGSTETLEDAFYIRKDTITPSYNNKEAGGDNKWRKDIGGVAYDVDFTDPGGGLLKDAQYKIVSATDYVIADWYTYASDISSDTYTDDFSIPLSTFALFGTSFTYVSVRAYDYAGNTVTITNAFYIKKDTVAPTYDNTAQESGDNTWRRTARSYNVDFFDNVSGLSSACYKAVADGEDVIPLTPIPGVNGNTEFTALWDVDFDSLKCGTTNYISIEIYDIAGNTTPVTDAFYVKKDTIPPEFNNQQSGDNTWRSTNDGWYEVYFTDPGGSLLDRFEIKVTTGQNYTGIEICDWTDSEVDISSTASYSSDWQIPDAVFDNMNDGKNYVHVKAYDIAGSSAVLDNAFYVMKGTVAPSVTCNFSGDNTWRNKSVNYDVDFNAYGSKLSTGFYRIISSTDGIIKDWTVIFSSPGITTYDTDWKVDFNVLHEETTNYIDVKVYDEIGNCREEPKLFYIKKDTTTPAINNNEENGDNIWRNVNDGIYDIDYTDSGGSRLKGAEYKIVSATDYVISDWYAYASDISSNSYTADFTIPNSTFSLFMTSYTYFSVRVYDVAGNTTTLPNAFYIKKDTITPTHYDGEPGDVTWVKTGRNSDIRFYDDLSGLNGAKYKAVADGGDVISYTPVSPEVDGSSYETAWGVAFDSLKDGATNYVSIEVYDIAGNTKSITDAFYVRKDTTVPDINNGEFGGDSQWRKTGESYNVGFSDYGSGLSKAVWECYYDGNFISSGGIDGVSGPDFSTSWPVDFDSLVDEATNWIKVEVYDVATNTKTEENAFKILKDTSPPEILKYQAIGDDSWIKSSIFYDVDFRDTGSRLDSAQYKALKNGATLIPWKDIFNDYGQSEYTDDWDVVFSSLTEGYNYVSIRAWDNLASTEIVTDAFYVKKDTTMPDITVIKSSYTWAIDQGDAINVDFSDYTSELDYAEYIIYSSTGMEPGSLRKSWSGIFNSTNVANYDVEWSIDFGALLPTPATNWFSVKVCDNAGNVKITTDAFKMFKVSDDPVVNDQQDDVDTWVTVPGDEYNVFFETRAGVNLDYFEAKLCSEPHEGGTVHEDWAKMEEGDAPVYDTPWEIHFSSAGEGINYVSVRVFDVNKNTTTVQDVFYIKKDTTSPEITNNISGGDTNWRKINNGYYDIDFYDFPSGSMLDYVQYKITSTAGGLIVDWSTPTALSGLSTHTYTAPWQIEDAHFALLPPNTNYVSVRVFNEAGLSSTTLNAFYIKKDTAAPTYDNNEDGGDSAWRRTSTSYDIKFYDDISGLSGAGYRAVADSVEVIPLTAIPGVIGSSFTTPWDVQFSSLTCGATNYITVEIYDVAGNTTTIPDAFYIKKDTVPPEIDNSLQPGDDTWRSTNDGWYKVYFTDPGGSLLDRFEIKVTTGQDYTGILVTDWTDSLVNISSEAAYNTDWQIPDAIFDNMRSGKNYVHINVYDIAGSSTVQANSFYVLKDTVASSITCNFSGDDTWRKESVSYDVDFEDYNSKLSTGYYRLRSSTDGVIKDWTVIFSSPGITTYDTDWQVDFSVLHEETTNYVDVRVYDMLGNSREELKLFYIKKDTSVPVITNNEENGDDEWRKVNDGVYDVDYMDTGGSRLKGAEYRIVSATDHVITDWYAYVLDISSNSYTTDFTIPNSTFSLFMTSYTYISVRVYDVAGNTATLPNAFYIKKDTAAPQIQNGEEGGDPVWCNTGRSYNVNFIDSISRVRRAQYAVYTATGMESGQKVDWTDIVTSTYTDNYTLDWSVDFNNHLAEGVTNYVSVRCSDWAGSTNTLVDAFYVLKDTHMPQITSNITDGDTTWRKINNGYYNVDFTDTGGSMLYYAETSVRDGPGGVGNPVEGWRVQVSSIDLNSYDTDWQISTETWNSLIQGKNYVTIKAWDHAGNSTETVDAFFILKDTAYPVVSGYEVIGDTDWIKESRDYNINFTDTGSWLEGARYTVYSATGMKGGTEVIGWQDIFSSTCTDYDTDWSVLFSSLTPGYNYVSIEAYDHVANTETVVDAFFIKKDTSVPYMVKTQTGDSKWRRINNGTYDIAFYDVGHSSISYFQTRASTSTAGDDYLYDSEWEDEYSGIVKSSYAAGWKLAPHWEKLMEGVTNYISVRVTDLAGNTSSWSNAFYVLKDTSPPVLNDLQDGDTTWRRISDGAYNITYTDTGGSKLDYVQYKIVTDTDGIIVDWSTYASGILSNSYTDPLSLDPGHFAQISSSYSYVWARAFDVAGATTTSDNYVFYVKKDTVPPVITPPPGTYDTWQSSNAISYSVDFEDTISLLDYAEYRIKTVTGGVIVDWTTPTALSNLSTNSYTADWQIDGGDFNALLPNATSYVDVRVYDNAGSTDTEIEAFFIRKDTIPPAAITDLDSVQGPLEGEISLSWTVTGDEGNSDYIENGLYEIRYDEDPVTWETADFWIQIPTATSAGNKEGYILTGLDVSTTYYAWIRIRDKAINWSSTSTYSGVVSGSDTTKPGQITDLVAGGGGFQGQVEISWTAPGDNGYIDPVTGYIVKYTTYSDFSWVKATTATWVSINPELPASTGTVHTAIFTNLNPDLTYWWGIRAYDEVPNYSVLSNTSSCKPAPVGERDAMLIYGEGTSGTPKTKVFSGGTWPDNHTDGVAAAATIRWIVLRSNNIQKNEKMAGILSDNNTLYIQSFDGMDGPNGTWTNRFNVSPGISAYRCFDIAYEQNTGRCVVAYYNGTWDQISYRVWSSTASDWVVSETPVTLGSLNSDIYWVRLEPMPGTNEMMLATLDSNNDIWAYHWNGSSFTDGQNMTEDATYNQYECFDISWENQTGRCMVIFGEVGSPAAQSPLRYRMWDTAVWGAVNEVIAGATFKGYASWVSAASDPSSNRIGFTVVDDESDWNAGIWDGNSWTYTGEDASIITYTSRIADCAWEKDSGKFIVVCAAEAADKIDWAYWQSGAWNNADGPIAGLDEATQDSEDFGSGNLKWLRLSSDPNVNKMILTAIEDGDSISTLNWDGAGWSLGNWRSLDSSDFNFECAFVAQDMHDNVPPILTDDQLGYDVWQSTNAGGYDVNFSDTGNSKLAYFQTMIDGGEGWTTVKSGLNVDSYTDNWKLLDSTFDSMTEGSNDVYVRVYDGVGNMDESVIPCFYVRKDTTPPSISENVGDYTWRNSTGMEYNVDFSDTLSKLDDMDYAVYPSSGMEGTPVKGWTPVFTDEGAENYTTDWEVDFYSLNPGTDNWVSVRVWDVAGSSIVYKDIFVVWKDTVAPNNIINLSVSAGQTYAQIKLSWAAPGDNGTTGDNTPGSGYLVKYSTTGIIDTDEKWDDSIEYSQTWPVSGQGQTEEHIIVGLTSDLTYWFAIKTRDKVEDRNSYNWSGRSNSPAIGVIPQPGNLFINEVYARGSSGSDWLELYNDTKSSINLAGWEVIYDNDVSTFSAWDGAGIISSGTFLLIDTLKASLDLDHNISGKVSLYDLGDNLVSYIQYPVFSDDASMSRIYDGGNYLGIDLSPTKGFANSMSTHPVKINEVNYATDEFIELYNTGSATITLSGYSLWNKNKKPFVFKRKIYPYSFTAIDFSSIDNSENTYTYNNRFGGGLDPDSDFIILENPSGQVVDMVSWQDTGAGNVHYSKDANLVFYINGAPSGESGSIGRADTEGKDTDVDSADFIRFTTEGKTLGSRNTTGTQPTTPEVSYPSGFSVIPRNFKIELTLNAVSSGGNTDTVWFIRTSGDPDDHSPHIYRLVDLGFSLSDTSLQVSTITGVSQNDLDGYTLSTGTVYRMILNSDDADGSADQVIRNNITYDASIHSVTVSSVTPSFGTVNEEIKAGLLRIDVANDSQAGYDIELERIAVTFLDENSVALSTEAGRNLFDEIYVVLNSTDYGGSIMFQPNRDTYVGSVSSDSFNFISGRQVIPVSNPDSANTTVGPQGSKTYFIAVKISSGAAEQAINTFSATIDGDIDVFIREAATNVGQDIGDIDEVNCGNVGVIEEVKTAWANVSTSSAPVYSIFDTNIYGMQDYFMGSDDGKLRAFDVDGNEKWEEPFTASDKIRTNVWASSQTGNVYLYIADESGNIYKIRDDGSSYTPMWSKPLGEKVSYVVEIGSYVFAPCTDGTVYRLNKETGQNTGGWSGVLAGSLQGAPIVMNDWRGINALWVASDNGNVYRMQLGDGSETSSLTLAISATVFTWPTLEAGYYNPENETNLIFMGASDGKVYCRASGDMETFPESWKIGRAAADWGSYDSGSPIRGAIHKGMWKEGETRYLYFGNDAGKLYKICTTSGVICAGWDEENLYQAEGKIRMWPMMLTGSYLGIGAGNDYVYFGDDKGYFYAVAASNGSTLRDGYPVYLGSAVTSKSLGWDGTNKRLFVGTEDGRVHAIYIGP